LKKFYHAVAIHDRLGAFQPCLALRDPKHAKNSALAKPFDSPKVVSGLCHYDLARQEFQFFREGGS